MSDDRALRDQLEALQARARAVRSELERDLDRPALLKQLHAQLEELDAEHRHLQAGQEAMEEEIRRLEARLAEAVVSRPGAFAARPRLAGARGNLGSSVSGLVFGLLVVGVSSFLLQSASPAVVEAVTALLMIVALGRVLREAWLGAARGQRKRPELLEGRTR